MVDVKVKAGVVVTGKVGVVVTGKVGAVDKEEAVVGVNIVWVTGLLDVDIVVVVIITGELEIAKVVCFVLEGLAVLIRSVDIVDSDDVVCIGLVLGPREGVELDLSEEL